MTNRGLMVLLGVLLAAFIVGGAVAIIAVNSSGKDDTEDSAAQVAYTGRVDLVLAQRSVCEGNKRDRKDTADFQSAYGRYNQAVLDAASVKGDVKAAAANLRKTVKRTAPSLRSRTGENLDCENVPSDPPLPAGVVRDPRLDEPVKPLPRK